MFANDNFFVSDQRGAMRMEIYARVWKLLGSLGRRENGKLDIEVWS